MRQFLDRIDQERLPLDQRDQRFFRLPSRRLAIQVPRQAHLFLLLFGGQATVTFRSFGVMPKSFIKSSIFLTAPSPTRSALTSKNGLVVATDDFLLGSFNRSVIVHNGKANHVDAHVCWRSVRRVLLGCVPTCASRQGRFQYRGCS